MSRSIYETNLKNFRRYQGILSEIVCDELIDLDEIAHQFVLLTDNCEIIVRYIPFEGDYVYVNADEEQSRGKKIEMQLDHLSDSDFERLIEIMRKCMIIEELRNTLLHEHENL